MEEANWEKNAERTTHAEKNAGEKNPKLNAREKNPKFSTHENKEREMKNYDNIDEKREMSAYTRE